MVNRTMATAWMALLVVVLSVTGWGATVQPAAPAEEAKPAAPAPAAAPAKEQAQEPAAAEGGVVGWIHLAGPLRDGPPPYAWGDDGGIGLRDVVDELIMLADDDNCRGVVFRLDRPLLTMAQVDELIDAVHALQAAGKVVLAFAEEYDLHSYMLACHADQIILQHKGQVSLSGLAIEEMYFAGLMEKLGMRADLVQVGQHKGAAEPFTRREPSPQWNQNIDPLIDDLYDQMLVALGESRGMERPVAEMALSEAWALSDEQLLQRRLVDRISSRGMTEVTGELFGDKFTWHKVGEVEAPEMDNPFALFQLLFQPQRDRITGPTIAVLNAYGPIVSGDGEGSLLGGEVIASEPMLKALGDIRRNPQIKGVVLRIDSPGGSAIASEMIWQGVRELAQIKPVFVSVGGMAASGGYYIACAGQRIYLNPSTIVGSIGVVGGKVILGGLYEKVGIQVHRRSRGPVGDLFNSVEPFTEAQRKLLDQAFQRTYEQFTDRVVAGRGERIADVEQVAQGRLFTGRQAVDNGLADELGGMDHTIASLAEQLELEEYDVVDFPAPKSLGDFLNSMFGGVQAARVMQAAPLMQAARQVVGPQGWRSLRWGLNGLWLLQREPSLLLMPSILVVR